MNFNDQFFAALKNEFKDSSNVLENNKGKTTIYEYPISGFSVDIKPYSYGVFVFSYADFKFFDYDKLKIYLENELKYFGFRFILSSHRIYCYPQNLNDINNCKEIFLSVSGVIKQMRDQILTAIEVK